MDEEKFYKIIPRHDTSTNWTLNNPILAFGEYGIEDDTHRIKRGDGVTDWVTLKYDTLGVDKSIEELLNDTYVQKEEGKGLSTNDFSDGYKTKLNNLENYNDTEVKELISLNAQNIETNRTNIETNTQNIKVNSLNIQQNETNITQLQQDLETEKTNRTNIDTQLQHSIDNNTTNIEQNASNIEKNTQDIQTNTTNIATLTNSINTNAINIKENATDINRLKDRTDILKNEINTEVDNRTTADNVLQTNITNEVTARQQADVNLQNQIDTITNSSDVVDVVDTYNDLENYTTTTLTDRDIIKVLEDETHNNATSYYRWIKSEESGSWNYVGSQGPTYTKGETDTLLNTKQNNITTENMLSADLVDDTGTTHKFTTSSDINKLADIEANAQVNIIEKVKVNGIEQTITNKEIDISVPTTDDINNLIDAKIAQITNAEEVQY